MMFFHQKSTLRDLYPSTRSLTLSLSHTHTHTHTHTLTHTGQGSRPKSSAAILRLQRSEHRLWTLSTDALGEQRHGSVAKTLIMTLKCLSKRCDSSALLRNDGAVRCAAAKHVGKRR